VVALVQVFTTVQPKLEHLTVIKFLRVKDVTARVGLTRSAIFKQIEKGQFPEPVSIGSRAIAWPESVVDEWAQARIAGGWVKAPPGPCARRSTKAKTEGQVDHV